MSLLQLTVQSRSATVVKSKVSVAFLCCHFAVDVNASVVELSHISSFFFIYDTNQTTLMLCTLTYKAVGSIWRNLSKPRQRILVPSHSLNPWTWVRFEMGGAYTTLKYFVKADATIRGLFKKFCYERLSIRKGNVCLTVFVHKYASFFHTCTCEISKESSKYQYSYWHLKWPQSYALAYI